MLGWIIVAGVVIGVLALKYFWEDIAQWLNNTAADAVEKKLGINAKKFMQKAVCKVTRVMNVLDNVATVFVKKDIHSEYMQKITLHGTAPVYEQSEDVLKEIEKEKELVNTFTYGNN